MIKHLQGLQINNGPMLKKKKEDADINGADA